MDRKNLPLVLMLVAGAITWIITYFNHYKPLQAYLILFVVMLFFYIVGTMIKWMFISFEKKNAEAAEQNSEEIMINEEQKEE